MLQREQAELRQCRRLRMAEDAENTTFLVKFVERKVHRSMANKGRSAENSILPLVANDRQPKLI